MSIKTPNSWNTAPSVLEEWTGRDDFIARISSDWYDDRKHVTGLIGFGGEGKSSLARKWANTILYDSPAPKPDGVFWWGFYDNSSVDEFLEAAVNYLSGERIDMRKVRSSNQRAQIIGAMLNVGRYLFVLDGLEVLQHQEGDQYGLLQNNDLRDLLTYFARPDNPSFCLITSRAPLLDLMDYTTYTHRDVERLSEEDGLALLQRLGVKGQDDELDKVVSDWGGHALTLSILASYLAERYQGDIQHLSDIPVPTSGEPRYERVHRILRRYDEHLAKDEREFLKFFSVFRLPVEVAAFEKVFIPLLKYLDKEETVNLVSRIASYRLISYDKYGKTYTTHPLIRDHYFTLFSKGDPLQEKAAHEQIKDYYLSIAGDIPQFPTLDDLKPLIEVVYHLCGAGAYDEAYTVYFQRIQHGARYVLALELGAYDTDLNLLTNFFPNDDLSLDPQVNISLLGMDSKSNILNQIGISYSGLGQRREAVQFFERSISGQIEKGAWVNASQVSYNIAATHLYLGALTASIEMADQALHLARLAKNNIAERSALSCLGSAYHVQGNLQNAVSYYSEAEKIIIPEVHTWSIRLDYARLLQDIGDLEKARSLVETELQICEQNQKLPSLISCHLMLGSLDSDEGNRDSAREHYETAYKIAQSISNRASLIGVRLSRGLFFAKHMKDASTAFSDLNQVFDYYTNENNSELGEIGVRNAFAWAYMANGEKEKARQSAERALQLINKMGYRIGEANTHVVLAWAYLANGEKEKARQSAERALDMSNEMGYHWGKVDAEEVLKAMSL